jgi:DNA-binding NarL/FixJ family response regulator
MIKVAIIEDNKAFSEALHHLIDNEEDIYVNYSAHNCNKLAEAIKNSKPHVVIMDIEMPGINGIEGVKIDKDANPDTQVFMLTTFEDNDKIFNSIKAGAAGYILKNDAPEEIVDAIRKVHNGESVMNGRIARKVLQYFNNKEEANTKKLDSYNLTIREKQVLELLIKGLSYKDIAAECFISNATVFTHVKNIYAKLDVHSRAELSGKLD